MLQVFLADGIWKIMVISLTQVHSTPSLQQFNPSGGALKADFNQKN
jgi:hypothetical protein